MKERGRKEEEEEENGARTLGEKRAQSATPVSHFLSLFLSIFFNEIS